MGTGFAAPPTGARRGPIRRDSWRLRLKEGCGGRKRRARRGLCASWLGAVRLRWARPRVQALMRRPELELGSIPAAPGAAEGPAPAGAKVPATLRDPGALRFWLAVALTGMCAGLGAAALTLLFRAAQELAWGVADPSGLFEAARQASPLRHVALLLGAGLLTG